MAKFVSRFSDAEEVAGAINAALHGETANIGRVTFEAGEDEKEIKDSRCRAGRLTLLIPLSANSAGVSWYLKEMSRGKMVFALSEAAEDDLDFGWVILGDGLKPSIA